MADVVEINALTGEVVERDFTPEELVQRQLDQEAAEQAEADRLAAEEEREATRQAALAKLEALGITEAEFKAVMGA